MNNARSDNQDRKRLFNFTFPKFMEKKLHEYSSKYDYFKVDKSLLGDAQDQIDLVDPDIDENPDDDISVDYEENLRFNSGFRSNTLALKAEELDELDDIEAMIQSGATQPPKQLNFEAEWSQDTKRAFVGAASSSMPRSEADELQELDEEEMLDELSDLVKQHKSTTAQHRPNQNKPSGMMDIEAELGDII